MQAAREHLLALYRSVLDAHLRGDVDAILRDESDDDVVASRGAVSHPTG